MYSDFPRVIPSVIGGEQYSCDTAVEGLIFRRLNWSLMKLSSTVVF